MRGGAAVLLAVALLGGAALLAPSTEAIHRGEKDRNFLDHYEVRVRVVNETGWPVSGVEVRATLLGLTTVASTDCGGDATLFIPTQAQLHRYDELTIVAGGQTRKVNLGDGEYLRRTDAVYTVAGTVTGRCSLDSTVEAWFYRYTMEGRIVERVEPYTHNGLTFTTRPVVGEEVKMTLLATWTNRTGEPQSGSYAARGRSGPTLTGHGGDFQFSFTVADELDGGFRVEAANVTRLNFTLTDREINVDNPDFHHRFSSIGVIRGEGSRPTPADGAAWLLALAAVAALAVAGRRRRA